MIARSRSETLRDHDHCKIHITGNRYHDCKIHITENRLSDCKSHITENRSHCDLGTPRIPLSVWVTCATHFPQRQSRKHEPVEEPLWLMTGIMRFNRSHSEDKMIYTGEISKS